MEQRPASRSRAWKTVAVTLPTLLAVALAACGIAASPAGAATRAAQTKATTAMAAAPAHRSAPVTSSELSLYLAMRTLWDQHMEWTYSTVAAFAAGTKGLTPTLDRLLQNQADIGNAIKPYYGNAAGDELTKLLRTHILD
ncbi:MAG: hypothetical protein ACRDNS_12225, partial [Trebonia sp.]